MAETGSRVASSGTGSEGPVPARPAPASEAGDGKGRAQGRWHYAAAALVYAALVLACLPEAVYFLTANLVPVEGAVSIYHIYWFSEVIYGDGDSIWFMPNLFYPHGMYLMEQSAGILKQWLAALLGGGAKPWLANNIIHVTTPVTVALTGFFVARRRLRAPFWIALAVGWFVAWTYPVIRMAQTPWLVSSEGALLFLYGLLRIRDEKSEPALLRAAFWTGLAGAVSLWVSPQSIIHLFVFGVAALGDRLLARAWRQSGIVVLAGGVALLASLPIHYETWITFGGSMERLGGGWEESAPVYSATLTEILVPPAESRLLGWLTRCFTDRGANLRTWSESYVCVLIWPLAILGLLSRKRGTGFLAASAVLAWLLALGPVMAVNELTAETKGMPGLFQLVGHIPGPGSMRVMRRYCLTADLALGLLAGYGLMHLYERYKNQFLRDALPLFLILLVSWDMRHPPWPQRLEGDPEPAFLQLIAEEPGMFAVLDLPYSTASETYCFHGAIHKKGVLWGWGSRMDMRKRRRMEMALYFPGLDVTPPPNPDDYGRFARGLLEYNVRYILVHEQYLVYAPGGMRREVISTLENPAIWARQPYIEPPLLVNADDTVRAYLIRPRRILRPGRLSDGRH
ncbi:hypothetical protein HZA57_00860 [Candidatus Poribacteria bacterium]|nr:hypothetical protein [Candidatus Poribacteria bacterium]